MDVKKSEYYLERKDAIELYFRGGQFVDAELHLIVSNSSPGSSRTIRIAQSRHGRQISPSGIDLNRVVFLKGL